MTEKDPSQEENISAEFRALGEHLKEILRAAWERPERQQLQNEIESGVKELGISLKEASDEFSRSDVGQRVKAGVEEIRTRVESGEVEKTVRKDLGRALQTVNAELKKLSEKLQASGASGDTGEET